MKLFFCCVFALQILNTHHLSTGRKLQQACSTNDVAAAAQKAVGCLAEKPQLAITCFLPSGSATKDCATDPCRGLFYPIEGQLRNCRDAIRQEINRTLSVGNPAIGLDATEQQLFNTFALQIDSALASMGDCLGQPFASNVEQCTGKSLEEIADDLLGGSVGGLFGGGLGWDDDESSSHGNLICDDDESCTESRNSQSNSRSVFTDDDDFLGTVNSGFGFGDEDTDFLGGILSDDDTSSGRGGDEDDDTLGGIFDSDDEESSAIDDEDTFDISNPFSDDEAAEDDDFPWWWIALPLAALAALICLFIFCIVCGIASCFGGKKKQHYHYPAQPYPGRPVPPATPGKAAPPVINQSEYPGGMGYDSYGGNPYMMGLEPIDGVEMQMEEGIPPTALY